MCGDTKYAKFMCACIRGQRSAATAWIFWRLTGWVCRTTPAKWKTAGPLFHWNMATQQHSSGYGATEMKRNYYWLLHECCGCALTLSDGRVYDLALLAKLSAKRVVAVYLRELKSSGSGSTNSTPSQILFHFWRLQINQSCKYKDYFSKIPPARWVAKKEENDVTMFVYNFLVLM